VGIFPLFKAKPVFSAADQKRLVDAIRRAEQQTSGEIRVYVENKNPMVSPVERAEQVFYKLKMQNTLHRNGVLIYIAVKHKELALFGDEGIYKITGEVYWKQSAAAIIADISHHDLIGGIEKAIMRIGETLKEKFPFEKTTDKNELPDEIVFGK
jgi:uncharacterized membrane protein